MGTDAEALTKARSFVLRNACPTAQSVVNFLPHRRRVSVALLAATTQKKRPPAFTDGRLVKVAVLAPYAAVAEAAFVFSAACAESTRPLKAASSVTAISARTLRS